MDQRSPIDAVSRRDVMKAGLAAAAGACLGASACGGAEPPMAEAPFRISLAEWSFHRAIAAGTMTSLDFARRAKQEFGIEAIEYVNSFLRDHAQDKGYLDELNKRAGDLGVRQLLIMCDGEGALGDPDEKKRLRAVENHVKWLEAARHLGGHSIRVNAASSGSFEEQQRLAADGLRRLCERAAPLGLNVIVENHGGLSSNGAWLAGVMKLVGHPRAGTLPDFGNFNISATEKYDRYKGVGEMMPFARAVSAKSMDFDERGMETTIDYPRMVRLVVGAGYHGHLGIEYEGTRLSEDEGVAATKRLLERIRAEIAATPGGKPP